MPLEIGDGFVTLTVRCPFVPVAVLVEVPVYCGA